MACKKSGVRVPVAPLCHVLAGQRPYVVHHLCLRDGISSTLATVEPDPVFRYFRRSGAYRYPGTGACAICKKPGCRSSIVAGQRAVTRAGYHTGYRRASARDPVRAARDGRERKLARDAQRARDRDGLCSRLPICPAPRLSLPAAIAALPERTSGCPARATQRKQPEVR